MLSGLVELVAAVIEISCHAMPIILTVGCARGCLVGER